MILASSFPAGSEVRFALLIDDLQYLWSQHDAIAIHHDTVEIGNQKLAVEVVEAVTHRGEFVVLMDEMTINESMATTLSVSAVP